MAGEVMEDPILKEAGLALRAGSGVDSADPRVLFEANKELMSLHELIGHRLFQILIGANRGRIYSL